MESWQAYDLWMKLFDDPKDFGNLDRRLELFLIGYGKRLSIRPIDAQHLMACAEFLEDWAVAMRRFAVETKEHTGE